MLIRDENYKIFVSQQVVLLLMENFQGYKIIIVKSLKIFMTFDLQGYRRLRFQNLSYEINILQKSSNFKLALALEEINHFH